MRPGNVLQMHMNCRQHIILCLCLKPPGRSSYVCESCNGSLAIGSKSVHENEARIDFRKEIEEIDDNSPVSDSNVYR